jgi:hypothetical protein
MYEPLDDECFEEEYGESAELLYSKELKYSPKFMEKKDETGAYENQHHWMELNFVVSLFCYDYRLRVVVYLSQGDTWSTYIFDGRHVGANDSVDGLRVQFLDGMVPITGREKSFGVHYDGEHYEYLTLPV